MLGHASAAMTLDVYADLFESDLDAVADDGPAVLTGEHREEVNLVPLCRGHNEAVHYRGPVTMRNGRVWWCSQLTTPPDQFRPREPEENQP
jgi:hypothetical protein